jgi:predicted DCC family thiol-disulfide oxidoreductase YuxK
LRHFLKTWPRFKKTEACGIKAAGIAKAALKTHVCCGFGCGQSDSSMASGDDSMTDQLPSKQAIWFVYDGECPMCSMAAAAFEVRKAVGTLHLVNARADLAHPALAEVNAARLDLDAGMAIKYGGRLYHGADALHLMALIGSEHGWLNRMNALLFRSKSVARAAYPFMRAARNLAVALKGSGKINNLGRQG